MNIMANNVFNIDELSSLLENTKIGCWSWDCITDKATYSKEWAELLGYTLDEVEPNINFWRNLIEPQDIVSMEANLNAHARGEKDITEVEMHLRKKDGTFVWLQSKGVITEFTDDGKPKVLSGFLFNIDNTKLAEELEIRTKEIAEHNTMMEKVTEFSQKIMACSSDLKFVIGDCLQELCGICGGQRITAWKDITIDGEVYTKSIFKWKENIGTIHRPSPSISDMSENIVLYDPENEEVYAKSLLSRIVNGELIKYTDHFPTLLEHINAEKIMNVQYDDVYNIEKAFLRLEGVSAALITPAYFRGKPWGYIRIDSFEAGKKFSPSEEKMISIVGTLFANAMQKSEMEEELRIAHNEAIASSKAKSNFLANMSHEIRTPMNAITGMAEILLRELGDHAASEYAVGIKQASTNLLTIINDILDISKIESGKIDIIDSEYTLSSLLNDVITMARLRVEAKAIDFFSFIDSKLPQKLIGDEGRIKQILINLLTNAVKFTHSGHVAFSVRGEVENDIVKLVFKVKDTGVGIKSEDMKLLFEEFERINTTKNRSIEGTGLGLAISKQLCEMMGGQISLESEYGVGSTFIMEIRQKLGKFEPIASVPEKKKVLLYEARELYVKYLKQTIENLGSECVVCSNQSELFENIQEQKFDYIFTPSLHLTKVQQLAEKKAPNTKIVMCTQGQSAQFTEGVYTLILPASCIQVAAALNNSSSLQHQRAEKNRFKAPAAKVLVVDDNYVNLKVAKGLMEPYQFSIETAENGLIAVQKIKSEHFDLVFMDHMMPEMDGIDATIEIRKQEGEYYQNLPIIALTANAIIGIRELFIEEGMNDFLEKPIEMKKLNDILMKWLPKDMQIPIDATEKAEGETIDLGDIYGVDIASGVRAIGGNYSNYLDILSTYYADGVKKHSFIRTVFMKRDLLAFKTEVHAIKSASASIGALTLSEKAMALENASTKEDWVFIDENVENFLAEFHKVIDSVREYLADRKEEKVEMGAGSISLLEEKIAPLAEAIDYVDLTAIEEILEELCKFEWESPLDEYIGNIKLSIESYDYDEGMIFVDKIKELIGEI